MPREDLFFVVGPLRTGTSLLSRCIDDHAEAICLCESEINRALFRDYTVAHHCQRMNAHGMSTEEAIAYLDRKKQDDIGSLKTWYADVRPVLAGLYGKPEPVLFGDKSPDFYRSGDLVSYLAANHPLIYTVRDPRAIFCSIDSQTDSTPEEKAERWSSLVENFHSWEPYLKNPNMLVIRYEDLVRMPMRTMTKVYAHLGLPASSRFLEPFPRLHPLRFLWTTAIDWETGIHKDFDYRRIDAWTRHLTDRLTDLIDSDDEILQFMDRFGYKR